MENTILVSVECAVYECGAREKFQTEISRYGKVSDYLADVGWSATESGYFAYCPDHA